LDLLVDVGSEKILDHELVHDGFMAVQPSRGAGN